MVERKSQWPEVGDLAIVTIESVTTYGAYAKLDEYDKWAEEILQKVSQGVVFNIVKAGGQGTFRRDKLWVGS